MRVSSLFFDIRGHCPPGCCQKDVTRVDQPPGGGITCVIRGGYQARREKVHLDLIARLMALSRSPRFRSLINFRDAREVLNEVSATLRARLPGHLML